MVYMPWNMQIYQIPSKQQIQSESCHFPLRKIPGTNLCLHISFFKVGTTHGVEPQNWMQFMCAWNGLLVICINFPRYPL